MRKKKQGQKNDQPKVFTIPRVASFLIITAVAFSSAVIIFTGTGEPQYPLWLVPIALATLIVVTYYMAHLLPLVASWVRYLLDAVVGVGAGFSFICAEESTLKDGWLQNALTYFTLATIFISVGTYFGKHHPRDTDTKTQ